MLIKRLWKYEYFGELRKIQHSAKNVNKIDLFYGNIMLVLVTHLNYCILAWGYRCERITKLRKRI